MHDLDRVWEAMLGLAASSPYFLAYIFGAVLCVRNWSLHPRKSLFIGIGLGILCLLQLFGLFANRMILERLNDLFPDPRFVGVAYQLIYALPSSFGVFLILWGAFMVQPMDDDDE
ncbi:MAG: hypothetical protein R3C01_09425 [Planctomycetaceae bacterium]